MSFSVVTCRRCRPQRAGESFRFIINFCNLEEILDYSFVVASTLPIWCNNGIIIKKRFFVFYNEICTMLGSKQVFYRYYNNFMLYNVIRISYFNILLDRAILKIRS